MTLSDAQQELLHAWVDGETTAVEAHVVAGVLTTPATAQDAAEYIRELKRVRELLATHGGVPAPEGLTERVRQALRKDRPEDAPLLRFPITNWRTALVAAAAVVVVALALVFAPPTGQTVALPEVASIAPPAAAPDQHGDNGSAPQDRGGAPSETKPEDTAPPPAPSRDEYERAAPGVLRLDKGYDAPLEVSINMNRSRRAGVLQVYNDMLVVGSLHGDARLLDEGSSGGDWNDGDDFAGYDFSVYDGVEIDVPSERLPGLLSALNRMTNDQGYGEVILPGYMRAEVGTLSTEVHALQSATNDLAFTGDSGKESAAGAQGYLPNDVQRESLRRLADDLDAVKLDARLSRLLDDDETDTRHMAAVSRKVKLVIHLR
ncbi:MAG: hypothetical protein K8I27_07225 [Planctomycetes bacterium]|nr:hypothetical protein [Planctomycetota bacterium]